VTLAKMADLVTDRLIGRDSSGTGEPESLTVGGGIEFTGSGGIQTSAFTGDVTKTAGGTATTIADSAVTLAKMADMASASVFYRKTAGSGAPEVQTLATLKTDLGLTGTNSGDQTITLTGNVTGSGTGSFATTIANNAVTTAKINDDAVTYAKMQDVSATSQVLGRRSSGSGDVEECTLSQVLDFVGSAAQGDVLYRGASTWDRLGAGTRGRYLQTGGTSANPSWAQAAAFKNVIINGDMQVAQRATSFTSTGSANNNRAYTLDRWYIQSEGSTATSYGNNIINVDRDTDAPSSTSGLFESRINSLKMTVVSGNNNRKFGIAQIIEQRNCRHLRGATVSLSFKAKASASIGNVQAVVLEWTGTADSINSSSLGNFINTTTTGWNTDGNAPAYVTSISTTNTPSNLGVTTSWASYTIPNITISSSMNNLIVFIFNNDKTTTAGDALWITDVQLEPGPVATEYEYLPIDVQNVRCVRYFLLLGSGNGTIINSAFTYIGGSFFGSIYRMNIPMRGAPSLTLTTGTNYYGMLTPAGNRLVNSVLLDTGSASSTGVLLYQDIVDTTDGVAGYLFNNNASSFLALNAEL